MVSVIVSKSVKILKSSELIERFFADLRNLLVQIEVFSTCRKNRSDPRSLVEVF